MIVLDHNLLREYEPTEEDIRHMAVCLYGESHGISFEMAENIDMPDVWLRIAHRALEHLWYLPSVKRGCGAHAFWLGAE